MVVAERLKSYLDENGIRYEVLEHAERFTSREIAHALHVPGKELAKVVMVKADDRLLMAVVPSSFQLDLTTLARVVVAKTAALATEAEFRESFPDCETGAMPPFGNLYGLEVWVDRTLTLDREIVFEAGSHHEAIRLAYLDFAKLARPLIGDFVSP